MKRHYDTRSSLQTVAGLPFEDTDPRVSVALLIERLSGYESRTS